MSEPITEILDEIKLRKKQRSALLPPENVSLSEISAWAEKLYGVAGQMSILLTDYRRVLVAAGDGGLVEYEDVLWVLRHHSDSVKKQDALWAFVRSLCDYLPMSTIYDDPRAAAEAFKSTLLNDLNNAGDDDMQSDEWLAGYQAAIDTVGRLLRPGGEE
jgi:hypothetical protein